jgi:type IV secretory pathway VirB10-like protein
LQHDAVPRGAIADQSGAESVNRFKGKRGAAASTLSRRPATRVAFGFLVAIAYAGILAAAGFFISGAVSSINESAGGARATLAEMPDPPRVSAVSPAAVAPDPPPQAVTLAAPPPAPPPPEAAPQAPESPPVVQQTAAVESPQIEAPPPVAAAPPPEISAAVRDFEARGDERVQQGDIASARLFYERAADGGDSRAARRLGNSFDPAFLARWGVRFMRADPDEAARWYRRAGELGDDEAAQDLAALQKQ